MPRFKSRTDVNEPVDRYQWPAEYVTPTPEIGPALQNWRKHLVRDREIFLSYQKACDRDDKEYARFFKDCARKSMRLIRAVTLAIPWFDIPDVNQNVGLILLWPLDLETELDEVGLYIYLNYG